MILQQCQFFLKKILGEITHQYHHYVIFFIVVDDDIMADDGINHLNQYHHISSYINISSIIIHHHPSSSIIIHHHPSSILRSSKPHFLGLKVQSNSRLGAQLLLQRLICPQSVAQHREGRLLHWAWR